MLFYENYVRMCNAKNLSPSAVAELLGIKKSTVTRWKKGGDATDKTLSLVADYFDVDLDDIRNKKITYDGKNVLIDGEKTSIKTDEHKSEDDKLKFALFGGDGEITDAMFDEVKQFAQMVKLREETKKKG